MIAHGLVEAGATVYIACSSINAGERRRCPGPAPAALSADLATEDCRASWTACLEREPSLSILVNNSRRTGRAVRRVPRRGVGSCHGSQRAPRSADQFLAASVRSNRGRSVTVINIGSIGLPRAEESLESTPMPLAKRRFTTSPVLAKRLGPRIRGARPRRAFRAG